MLHYPKLCFLFLSTQQLWTRINRIIVIADWVAPGPIFPFPLRRSKLKFGKCLNTSSGLPSSSNANWWQEEGLENGCRHDECSSPSGDHPINSVVHSAEVINILHILRAGAWGPATETALRQFAGKLTHHLVIEVIKRQEADSALGFFAWAKKQLGYSHGTDAYNAMIENLAKAQKFVIALDLLKEMITEGCAVNARTFTPLIIRYGKAGMVEPALELLNFINAFNLQLDGRLLNCYRTLFCENRHLLLNAEDIVAKVTLTEKEAFDLLIDCLGRAGKLDDAWTIMNEMEQRGFIPDTHTYATLIDCNCREGNVGKADELITLMRHKGLQFGASVYNPICYYYCRCQNIERALEVVKQMKKEGCYPNIITCNILMIGLLKVGHINRALSLYQVMLREGPVPSQHTYGILFHSLCYERYVEYDKLCKLFSDALNMGVKFHAQTINFVLRRFCNSGKLEEAESLLRRLAGVVSFDSHTFGIMIRGYFRAGKLERAKQLFEEMKSRGINPDISIYFSLVTGFSMQRRFEEIGRIVEEMIEICSDLGFDCYVTSSLLKKLCRPGLENEALKFGWHVAMHRLRVRHVDALCLINFLHLKGHHCDADNVNRKLLEGGCIIDPP